jgi:hypothetical protein
MIRKDPILTSLIALIVLCTTSWGDSLQVASVHPQDYLGDSITSLGMVRSAERLVFRGDSLSQYLNDADFYHRFHFIEVASTEYKRGEITTVADVFRFDSSLNAYGIYSHLRWGNTTDLVPVGIEGFRLPTELTFVKGPYVATLTGFSESPEAKQAIEDLAGYLADNLPGTGAIPDAFALFPQDGILPGSTMYFPNRFLGLPFGNSVYACDYFVGPDTVFLFLSVDNADSALLQWRTLADEKKWYQPLPDSIPYDSGQGFIAAHERLGNIMIGVKNDILAGMIGYNERCKPFLIGWFSALAEDK